jgi:glutamate---cysteine ligase / carboxylate-amine ligase
MGVRKVGVEEELILIDPETRLPTALSERAVAAHTAQVVVTQELFLQQIETATEPCTTNEEILTSLQAGRRAVGEAAAATGARAIAVATHPFTENEGDFTPRSRYQRIKALGGETARDALLCGMHVHVDVDSDDEGVAVIDRIRPWLPVLLALSSNSPYWRGRDTSHASWRSQLVSRWPTAGAMEPFVTPDGYRQVADWLQAWGAALDTGMLYFDVRLAEKYPTVEVRVADVCTDLEEALLVVLLTRALVTRCATAATDPPSTGDEVPDAHWRSDLLRAATWRAARFGTSGAIVHPVTRQLTPVRAVVRDTVEWVRPALEEAGDLDQVVDGANRLLSRGSGATRQRRVIERTGRLVDVVDDLANRTEASWTRS